MARIYSNPKRRKVNNSLPNRTWLVHKILYAQIRGFTYEKHSLRYLTTERVNDGVLNQLGVLSIQFFLEQLLIISLKAWDEVSKCSVSIPPLL